jgi:hypothetical protein
MYLGHHSVGKMLCEVESLEELTGCSMTLSCWKTILALDGAPWSQDVRAWPRFGARFGDETL